MKKCASCGKEVSDNVYKCPNCNSTTFKSVIEFEEQIACPNCGKNNPMRRSICSKCGASL